MNWFRKHRTLQSADWECSTVDVLVVRQDCPSSDEMEAMAVYSGVACLVRNASAAVREASAARLGSANFPWICQSHSAAIPQGKSRWVLTVPLGARTYPWTLATMLTEAERRGVQAVAGKVAELDGAGGWLGWSTTDAILLQLTPGEPVELDLTLAERIAAPAAPGDAHRRVFQAMHRTISRRQHDGHQPEWPHEAPDEKPALQAIAFFLPQYHRVPENDEWWGKGLTEWRHATTTFPEFEGHEQPKLPADLGYYDLTAPGIWQQQATLIKKYGLAGLCIYRYWYDGQEMLEAPLQQLLAQPDVDLPYCLCWANHHWTRAWQSSNEVLLRQPHGNGTERRFIESMEPFFRDPRYIRYRGRPVLLVFFPQDIPDLKAVIADWRQWCIERGLGNPWLVRVQSTPDAPSDPEWGFDARVQYAASGVEGLLDRQEVPTLHPDIQSRIFDYRDYAAAFKDFGRWRGVERMHPGVAPGWDNTSRYPGGAFVAHGSTPERFREWVEHVHTALTEEFPDSPEDRFFFVNAWNEWAEGAMLEPDLRWGHAYLRSLLEGIRNRFKS